jgi:2-dehydropantoate 2-reductase
VDGKRIVIAGAGAVGFYVGGLLAAAGRRVTFLGRPRLIGEVAEAGLKLSDVDGLDRQVVPKALALTTDPEALVAADLILVCVKDAATAEIAEAIAEHASPLAPVISLQNGLASSRTLRAHLPGRDVRAGVVAFNVVPKGPGRFHKAVSGDITISAGPGRLAAEFSVEGLTVYERDEIGALQWGKLLLNLTNALNALSGITLYQFLLDRDWRRLMADQMAEALRVLRASDQPVERATPMPSALLPFVLRLPTPVFRRIAGRMLKIDPTAKTSMAYDLEAGRPTEIGALQGEVIALGRAHGCDTPLNEAVAACIGELEGRGAVAPEDRPTPQDIRRRAAQFGAG